MTGWSGWAASTKRINPPLHGSGAGSCWPGGLVLSSSVMTPLVSVTGISMPGFSTFRPRTSSTSNTSDPRPDSDATASRNGLSAGNEPVRTKVRVPLPATFTSAHLSFGTTPVTGSGPGVISGWTMFQRAAAL